jgi:hypothetical protein
MPGSNISGKIESSDSRRLAQRPCQWILSDEAVKAVVEASPGTG